MAITTRRDKGSALTYDEMDDNFEAIAPRDSETGSVQIPAGTTTERTASPQAGMLRYNSSSNVFEGYQSGAWQTLALGSGGEINQNAFSEIQVSGQATVQADQKTDAVTFVAGTNMSITTAAGTDTITFAASAPSVAFSDLTSTPTTISGYGITDAFDGAYSSLSGIPTSFTPNTHTQPFSSLTNLPTTLAGYGITDAFDGDYNNLTNVPSTFTPSAHNQAWSTITGTPTTIAGYGITDSYTDSSVSTHLNVSSAANNEVLTYRVDIADFEWVSLGATFSTSDVDTHLNTGTATANQLLSWDGSDYDWIAAPATYGDADVDAHINVSAAGTNQLLSWNGADYSWIDTPATYGDSDVDTHINTSTANTNQILSWTGTDYDWVDPENGGISFVVTPIAFATLRSVSANTTYTGMTAEALDYSAGNYSRMNFTFNTAQPDTNYTVVSDWELVEDNNIIEIKNKANTGFTAEFYAQSTGSPLTAGGVENSVPVLQVFGSTPTKSIIKGDELKVITTSAGANALSYNQANGTFIFTPTSGGGGAELNDLSSIVTWTNVPDAYITQSSVTQHQAAFQVTESQITDLQSYITGITGESLSDLSDVATPGVNDDQYVLYYNHPTTSFGWKQMATGNTGGGGSSNTNLGTSSLTDLGDVDGVSNIDNLKVLYYDDTAGVFRWGYPDLTVTTNSAGTAAVSYNRTSGTITYTPPDLSGYLTSETSHADVVVDGDFISQGLMRRGVNAGQYSIVTDNSANWNTAYSWGDHGAQGYLTSETSHADVLVDGDFTSAGFMKTDGSGGYSVDTNTYLTSYTETDPVFSAHTTSNIINGTGFLKNNGSGTWTYDNSTYLTSETSHADVLVDGDFTSQGIMLRGASAGSYSILTDNSTNWNTAYGWGNHASAGYLTSETYTGTVTSVAQTVPTGFTITGSPITTSGTLAIAFDTGYSLPTTASQTNWDTAYGWGDHSVAGYTSYANSDVDAHLNQSNPTSGYVLSWNGTDYAWVAQSGGGGLADVVDDTSPQLGGDLDVNAKDFTSSSGQFDFTTATSATTPIINLIPPASHFDTQIRLHTNNSGAYQDIMNDSGVLKIRTNDANPMEFIVNGSTRITLPQAGDVDITGNLDVSDNIYVQGTASDGGKVILNSAQSGSPSSSSTNWSYIEVERGTNPNTSIRWHEGFDRWEFTNDGSNYYAIPTSGGSTPTLEQVLTSGDESDNTLTLYRTTDGNSAQGSLIFESRDTSPIQNNSMGDIRFYMDNDSNIATSTLGEYARISAKAQQVASGSAADNTGFIEFRTKTKTGVDTLMQVGFDPWSASGSSSGGNIGTVMHERAYVNGNFYLYQQVDTANDITSDAGLYMHLTAYDSVSGTIQNRGEINHQNGVFRIIHRNRNNTAQFGQLTIPHSSNTPLRIYYADDNSTNDIISEKNFDTAFNNRMLDDANLVRLNQYANTEYISVRSDFGDFNGGSAGQASLVPGNGGFGAVAFFTWADANNGTASKHRYIPAGHTEEAVHGMGILRDSGQHSTSTPRWDPFGGPDFRISLDSSASDANYFFGSTSTSNTKHTTNLIITNSDYTPLDGDDIARIKFRTGEDTYTQYRDYAEIVVNAQDTAAGAYDGRMTLWVNNNGGTGTNANIGIKLDGQGTTIQSRASQHYFGEFPTATLDNNTYPTDNYIKLITDNDDTRQVIQSAGDMWFSVDTAVSANTVMQLSSSEITINRALNAANNQITNLADPTSAQDAATKAYVDANAGSGSGMSNLIEDTTPQLGGALDTNGNQINFGDSNGTTNVLTFGASNDLKIYHFGNTYIENINWDLTIRNSANDYDVKIQTDNGSGGIANYFVADGSTGAAEMHWGDYSTNAGADGGVKLKTTATGVEVTGAVVATSFSGDGSGLTNLPSGGISNLVEDTTPQLGGDLDLNGFKFTLGTNEDLEVFAPSSSRFNIKLDSIYGSNYDQDLFVYDMAGYTQDLNNLNLGGVKITYDNTTNGSANSVCLSVEGSSNAGAGPYNGIYYSDDAAVRISTNAGGNSSKGKAKIILYNKRSISVDAYDDKHAVHSEISFDGDKIIGSGFVNYGAIKMTSAEASSTHPEGLLEIGVACGAGDGGQFFDGQGALNTTGANANTGYQLLRMGMQDNSQLCMDLNASILIRSTPTRASSSGYNNIEFYDNGGGQEDQDGNLAGTYPARDGTSPNRGIRWYEGDNMAGYAYAGNNDATVYGASGGAAITYNATTGNIPHANLFGGASGGAAWVKIQVSPEFDTNWAGLGYKRWDTPIDILTVFADRVESEVAVTLGHYTTTQRNALSSAGNITAGTMIWNTSNSRIEFWNGSSWRYVQDSAA